MLPTSPWTGLLERVRTPPVSRRSPPGSAPAPASPPSYPAVELLSSRPAQPASLVSSPAPVLSPCRLVRLVRPRHWFPKPPHLSFPRPPRSRPHCPSLRQPSPCSPQGGRHQPRCASTNWYLQFPSPCLHQGGHVLHGPVSTSRSPRLPRPLHAHTTQCPRYPVPTSGTRVPEVPFLLVTPAE